MLLRRTATLSALVSLFAVVLTGTVWVLGVERPGAHPADRPPPEATRQPAESASGRVGGATQRGGGAARTDRVHRRGERARRVLAQWDRSRALAWEQADEGRLRRLYLPGSRTGTQDVRMLRRWTERGVRVVDLRTEVEAVRVVERSPGRWVLRVSDRTSGSAVVGESGTFPLPQDGWSLRRIELRRGPTGWRVGEVRESAGR